MRAFTITGCTLDHWFLNSNSPNLIADKCRLLLSVSFIRNRHADGAALGKDILGATISGNYFHLERKQELLNEFRKQKMPAK